MTIDIDVMLDRSRIEALADGVIAGEPIGRESALELGRLEGPLVWELLGAANRIRDHFMGDQVHLCAIVNAKSGGCTEDCSFCSQSASHATDVGDDPFIAPDQIAEAADRAQRDGAQELGLVAAWRGLEEGPQLDRVVESIRAVAEGGQVKADASLGLIESQAVANRLAEAGLNCYNHNLETSRRFFDETCSTHDYDERLKTIAYIKEAGIDVCSGVLIGMGETWEDRVDAALQLRALTVQMVPMNFLHRIEGTPLADQKPLAPMEALQTLAVYRFILPQTQIMAAGGREVVLGDLQALVFFAGASATMVGNYLTTSGRQAEDDKKMIEDLGLHY